MRAGKSGVRSEEEQLRVGCSCIITRGVLRCDEVKGRVKASCVVCEGCGFEGVGGRGSHHSLCL